VPTNATGSLHSIAATIATRTRLRRALVAVDGGDGSGKTTFAEHLAAALRGADRATLVIHVDDFMHVRHVRHQRGRTSPVGYLEDSYDYASLTERVLEPLSRTGTGAYRAACVDRLRDVPITPPVEHADPTAITIVEGLFLHRDELAHWWDFSIFLDTPIDEALARKSKRDNIALASSTPLAQRYSQGQRAYRARYHPKDRATWVLGREDFPPNGRR
jgi:uridine kinase